MSRSPSGRPATEEGDRTGFDLTENELTELLGRFVPQSLARRAVTVSVSIPETEFSVGDPVPFTVDLANRLPVPVKIQTPTRRLWGWRVDGELEASDESGYAGDTPGVLELDGGDTVRIEREWTGRFKRTGGERVEYVLPDPGPHELEAFVATEPPAARDSVTLRLEG